MASRCGQDVAAQDQDGAAELGKRCGGQPLARGKQRFLELVGLFLELLDDRFDIVDQALGRSRPAGRRASAS